MQPYSFIRSNLFLAKHQRFEGLSDPGRSSMTRRRVVRTTKKKRTARTITELRTRKRARKRTRMTERARRSL